MDWPSQLPYSTHGLPGCGGRLRHEPEEFVVQELPAYLPSGSGEHIYLWVEKRGISTANLRSKICEVLGVSPKQVGHAGLKDSRAVSRQWISIHSHADLPVDRLESDRVKIRQASRHMNKLRPGHLRGNRFEITVRATENQDSLTALLERINSEGFPNYYGEQRFGAAGGNIARGRAILRSSSRPRMPADKARFLVNAYQSSLFNRLVGRRILETGSLTHMLAGDLAIFHSSSSFFPVQANQLEEARQRASKGEISPSAPLFGSKAPLAEGEAGEWEQALLKEEGLDPVKWRSDRNRHAPKGERRAVRAFPEALEWCGLDIDNLPCLRFTFILKPGTYATSFLREVMKVDRDRGEAEEAPGDNLSRMQDGV